MTSFKQRSSRLKFLSNSVTLDEIHKGYIEKLEKTKLAVPTKQHELEQLKSELKIVESNKISSMTDIKKRANIRSKIKSVETELSKPTTDIDMLEYVSKIGFILVDYYANQIGTEPQGKKLSDSSNYESDDNFNDNSNCNSDDKYDVKSNRESIEKLNEYSNKNAGKNMGKKSNEQLDEIFMQKSKKRTNIFDTHGMEIVDLADVQTATEMEYTVQKKNGIYISDKLRYLNELSQKTRKVKKPVKKRRLTKDVQPKKSIFDFFNEDKKLSSQGKDQSQNGTENTDGQNGSNKKHTINRATLQDKYLMMIDKRYVCDKIRLEKVVVCGRCNIEKISYQLDGRYVCEKCGETEYIIMENEITGHKEISTEKQKYPYKKINHLKEKLNQFQSKESADVPDHICEIVKINLRVKRISFENCTPSDIRTILKKKRLTPYYEHLQQIYCKISGSQPISLQRETEETVINMFQEMQPSFERHCPTDRSNFLSYSYVLNKLFRILKMKTHASYFSLLKSKEKLRQQDTIWKKICFDMDWKFHPSL